MESFSTLTKHHPRLESFKPDPSCHVGGGLRARRESIDGKGGGREIWAQKFGLMGRGTMELCLHGMGT